MDHAKLSPSGASRWLACTPSARLEKQFPDRAGAAAQEGTYAHELAEITLGREIGVLSVHQYDQKIEVLQGQVALSGFDWNSMQGYISEYVTYVMEQFAKARATTKDAVMHLERRVDLTAYVPEGFGTQDVRIVADGWLDIIDLKYGKGVAVSAVDNAQMKTYAMGNLEELDFIYDIQNVRMHIVQPRLDDISTFEMSAAALRQWGDQVLRPKAKLAFAGEGPFVPGPHCKFCKVVLCKARAEAELEVAKHEFAEPALLTDESVVDILSRAKRFTDWLKAVHDYALHQAVHESKKWPGMKLVAGRATRKYSDPPTVALALLEAGKTIEEIYKPREILGITALTGVLGKKPFETLVGPFLVKPPGKPTLAPDSDTRQEINSLEAAQAEFSDEVDVDN